MKRPLAPWIVSLLAFVIVLGLSLVAVLMLPDPAHAARSDFDSGEQLGKTGGFGAALVAIGVYVWQRRRVKRYEESQSDQISR